jgi:hypothetical protein
LEEKQNGERIREGFCTAIFFWRSFFETHGRLIIE